MPDWKCQTFKHQEGARHGFNAAKPFLVSRSLPSKKQSADTMLVMTSGNR